MNSPRATGQPGLRLSLDGDTLVLLPELALFWEEARSLVVADLHFGKSAGFRALTHPVPSGSTQDDLSRLSALLELWGAERLIVLGDLIHSAEARAPHVLQNVLRWRTRHSGMDFILVRGNHDRRAGDPPAAWGFHCVDEPLRIRGFDLRHHPSEDTERLTMCGHLHPAVRLRGRGGMRERVPCFWKSGLQLILPAFGSFTGAVSVGPSPGDQVFAVTGSQVVEIPSKPVRST